MKYTLSWFVDRFFIKQPRLRRFVTRILEGDSNKRIEVLGTSLTINTIKEHGYLRASRLCKSSSLLRDEAAVLINLAFVLDKHDTFIDVGANVGVYALTVSRFVKLLPELRVYAFEANPDTFSRLVESAPASVHAHQVAVSSRSGSLQFVEGAVSHVFTTSDHASKYSISGEVKSIESRRLDECGIEGDSLVIKIDVEGQEADVLLGASGLFEAGKVKAVYLDGYADHSVEGVLRNYGFQLFDGRTLERTDGNVFSLLAIHPDKQAGLIN